MNTKSITVVVSAVALVFIGAIFSSGYVGKEKVYHVGILSGVDAFYGIATAFKSEMAELGYIEGKNISYSEARLNADPAAVEVAAKRFVEEGVDLIFVFPTEPAIAAKLAAEHANIPVVFSLTTVEGSDLVQDIRVPGGNITGVRYAARDITLKRFEILYELVPNMKRLWIGYDPDYPAIKASLPSLREAVAKKGVTLLESPVRSPEEIEAALYSRVKDGRADMDAILVMPELVIQSPQGWPVLTKFTSEYRIPLGGSVAYSADSGALFSLIADNEQLGRLAAPLAVKIFKGMPAGTIPVVTPDSRLRINYALAESLGIHVDEGLLALAHEIIR